MKTNRAMYFLLSACILASGCATSQPDLLARQYCEAHQGYWQVVADVAVTLDTDEIDGIRFMHSVVHSMSEREATELRYLLAGEPQRVKTGPKETPWVMFELDESDQQELSSNQLSRATMEHYKELSDRWRVDPRRKQIQAIWKEAASKRRCRDALQARDKELNIVINEIKKFKALSKHSASKP